MTIFFSYVVIANEQHYAYIITHKEKLILPAVKCMHIKDSTICYEILNDPVLELNSTTFDTLAIQNVEAIHVTKFCFVLAFCQISLHPLVSELYNFPSQK